MVVCKVPKKNEKIVEAIPTDKITMTISIFQTPKEGFQLNNEVSDK